MIMMIILVLALTFGGFLYMDYLTEREKNRMIDRKIAIVKRLAETCPKE